MGTRRWTDAAVSPFSHTRHAAQAMAAHNYDQAAAIADLEASGNSNAAWWLNSFGHEYEVGS